MDGTITVTAVVGAALALAPAALAKDGDVRVAGTCTKASTSKLKLSREDGGHRGRVRGRPEPKRRPLACHPVPERHAGREPRAGHARPERLVRGAVRHGRAAGRASWRGRRARPARSARRRVVRVGTSRSPGGRGTIAPWPHGADIVATAAEAAGAERAPLVVLDRLEAFLDEHGLGAGPVRASRIGDGGGSNFSFLLERGDERFVLRRPPRPPLPPSAHDMVREARLQLALAPQGIRLPPILAICEDESVLGVPFYVMRFLDGHVVTDRLPAGLEEPGRAAPARRGARRRAGRDPRGRRRRTRRSPRSPGRAATSSARCAASRSSGRSTRRARSRPWSRWAGGSPPSCPSRLPDTVVHGDYRLGNLMVERDRPDRVQAVLDWEMGAIGDPRADLGYLLATYTEPGGGASPLGVSPVTALEGFPTKAELVERYVGAKRARGRAARLVRGARAVEGRGLLRGDLRPLRRAASSAPRTRARPPSSTACR